MLITRSVAFIITAAAAVIALIALCYAVLITFWMVTSPIDGTYTFPVRVVLPDTNELALHSLGSATAMFSDVQISSPFPLVAPRVLTGIATALPFTIVISAAVGVIFLSRRLASQRPFARAAQRSIIVLSVLAAVTSVIVPWFSALASSLAVDALGLPSHGEAAGLDGALSPEPWFVAPSFSIIQDLDWPLLTLACVLALVAVLWNRALRFQRETEGLI